MPDVLDGYERRIITMPAASDGPVEIVLVRRRSALTTNAGVLYVHGFVDYFFQTHLADFYEQQGLRFYAVDLRRHGRSLRPHQFPNHTTDIDEYLVDVAAAVDAVRAEGIDWLLLNGHSTGGLTAALFAHRSPRRASIDAVFLNSPFLDMNVPAWQSRVLEPLLAGLGRVAPNMKLPALSSLYGESIHIDRRGEWAFDLTWKPLNGFPARAGWLRAIHRAHSEVSKGLRIEQPVLLLHAQRSAWPKQWSDDCQRADIVLDVGDMTRLGPGLGSRVELVAIADGMHDLVLSKPAARAATFTALSNWLSGVRS